MGRASRRRRAGRVIGMDFRERAERVAEEGEQQR